MSGGLPPVAGAAASHGIAVPAVLGGVSGQTLVYGAGCIAFLLHFVADAAMAMTLATLKKDHPSIDAYGSSADDEPSGDDAAEALTGPIPAEVLGAAWRDNHAAVAGVAREAAEAATGVSWRYRARGALCPCLGGSGSGGGCSARQVHAAMAVCALGAPLVVAWQALWPQSVTGIVAFAHFTPPAWVSILAVLPAVAAAFLYALRAVRAAQLAVVTRSQWLALMWFRLDMMAIAATGLLFAWGAWLAAAMLYAVALHLARRLLSAERRLVSAADGSSLLRDEVDAKGQVVGVAVPPDHGATGILSSGKGGNPRRDEYTAVE